MVKQSDYFQFKYRRDKSSEYISALQWYFSGAFNKGFNFSLICRSDVASLHVKGLLWFVFDTNSRVYIRPAARRPRLKWLQIKIVVYMFSLRGQLAVGTNGARWSFCIPCIRCLRYEKCMTRNTKYEIATTKNACNSNDFHL